MGNCPLPCLRLPEDRGYFHVQQLEKQRRQGGKHQNLTKKTWCSSPTESTHCYIIIYHLYNCIILYPGIPIGIAIIAIPMAYGVSPRSPWPRIAWRPDRLQKSAPPSARTCRAARLPPVWTLGLRDRWVQVPQPQGCGKKRGHGCKKTQQIGIWFKVWSGMMWIEFVT